VVAWGDNSGGQATVPAGLTGVTAIAAGFHYTVALRRVPNLAADATAGDLPGGPPPGGFSSWAELMQVQAALDAQADAVTALGGGLGGIVVDPEARRLTVSWKGAVPARLGDLAATMPVGTVLQIRPAAYSRTELLDAVTHLTALPEVNSAGPEADGSGVSVGRRAGGEAVRASVAAKVAAAAGVTVHEVTAGPLDLFGRSHATPPYYGGAAWWGRFECSTGFAFYLDGRRKMLTAGHCAENGDSAVAGNGAVMGTVERKDAAHDRLLIDTPEGSGGWIWDGGVAEMGGTEFTKPVIGAAHSYTGDYVCSSGALSGAQCNIKVTGTDISWKTPDGNTVVQLVKAEQQDHRAAIGNGDSGGPVFSLSRDPNKVIAKGTITGSDDGDQASCQGVPGDNTRRCQWRFLYVSVGYSLIAYNAAIIAGASPPPDPPPPQPPPDRRCCDTDDKGKCTIWVRPPQVCP